MKNMKLISVIVPVYNVENYIRECIDSILAQTFHSFELLLIDDGSTDESGRICDEYKTIDSRIHVIHKENGGLSSARNRGLDESKGEYICFIDSDDAVKVDYLDKLYCEIENNNVDMVVCDIDASGLTTPKEIVNAPRYMSSSEAKEWLRDTTSREYVLMVVAWDKLYTKELWNGLRYPEGKLHEDEFMIGPILSRVTYISFIPEKLYVYRDNSSGITSAANRFNLRHLDAIDAYKERICGAEEDGDLEFAIATLKNALYKCARFYKEGKEHGKSGFSAAAMKKYREVFGKYKKLLDQKQRMKYRIFLVMPKIFVMLFNP
jgi:glycosyltransferase involved in cell wall biosynthesis